jgi:hypothetical protein
VKCCLGPAYASNSIILISGWSLEGAALAVAADSGRLYNEKDQVEIEEVLLRAIT